MTFFDNFKEFLKEYTRSRKTTTKNAFGENVPETPSEISFSGVISKTKGSSQKISYNSSEIPYVKSDATLYVSIGTDIQKGDTIDDSGVKYRVLLAQSIDDFAAKGSHIEAQLELIA